VDSWSKSEIRISNPETIFQTRIKCQNRLRRDERYAFCRFVLRASNLFRISGFGFGIL